MSILPYTLSRTSAVLALLLAALPVRAQEWTDAPALPAPRYDLAAAVVDGQIYVIGGLNKTDGVLSSVLRLDPGEASGWTEVAPLGEARHDAAAVVLDERIYVMGGADRDGEVMDDVEAYDPGEDRWFEIDDLGEARRGHQTVVLGGRIYVVGGVDQKGHPVADVEVYDASEDEWSTAEAWKPGTPRVSFALVALGDDAYSIGGFSGGGGGLVPVSSVEIFANGSVSTFTTMGRLKQRGRFAAVSIGGTAYVLGGIDHRGAVPDVVRFTPSAIDPAEQWQSGPQLQTPRERFAAAAVNGRLYAIGGAIGSSDSRLTELTSVETILIGTSAEGERELPRLSARLDGIFPNPFAHSATVTLVVGSDRTERLAVEVYDLMGRRIRTLTRGAMPRGRHEIEWDGRGDDGRPAASGTYVCVLRMDGRQTARAMILIR